MMGRSCGFFRENTEIKSFDRSARVKSFWQAPAFGDSYCAAAPKNQNIVIYFAHSEHLLLNRNSRLISFENQAAMYMVYVFTSDVISFEVNDDFVNFTKQKVDKMLNR